MNRLCLTVSIFLLTGLCAVFGAPLPTDTPMPTQTPIPTWTPTPTGTPTPAPTTGSISGKITNSSDGSPVPGANISTDPPTSSVTADTQGNFSITEVPPGTYAVTAVKAGYMNVSVSIAVVAGRTTTADVHLIVGPTDALPNPTLGLALTDGLVAYYPFNGDADDESDNEHYGMVNGATLAEDRFGLANRAYRFDGVDDYIDLGSEVVDQDSFSFSVWFKTGRDKYAQVLLGNYVACSYSGTGFTLVYYGSEVESGARLQLDNGSRRNQFATIMHPVNMSDGNWHHVVGVIDANEYSLYVDRVLVNVQVGTYAPTNESMKIGKAEYIGARCGDGKGGHFDGVLDDLRIYDRILSESEIETLYSEGGWQGN